MSECNWAVIGFRHDRKKKKKPKKKAWRKNRYRGKEKV